MLKPWGGQEQFPLSFEMRQWWPPQHKGAGVRTPLLPMTASDSFAADDLREQAFRTWAETQRDSPDVMEETSEQEPREGQQDSARCNVQHPEPIDLLWDEPGQKE